MHQIDALSVARLESLGCLIKPQGQCNCWQCLPPADSSQVLPVQQVSHDVAGDALGSVSHVKGVVLGHAVRRTLGQLKHQRNNLQLHLTQRKHHLWPANTHPNRRSKSSNTMHLFLHQSACSARVQFVRIHPTPAPVALILGPSFPTHLRLFMLKQRPKAWQTGLQYAVSPVLTACTDWLTHRHPHLLEVAHAEAGRNRLAHSPPVVPVI